MAIFHDMIRDCMECYVDDLIVKSKTREGHFEALERVLQRASKPVQPQNEPQEVYLWGHCRKATRFYSEEKGN